MIKILSNILCYLGFHEWRLYYVDYEVGYREHCKHCRTRKKWWM